jgi:hypothetical protein
MPVLQEIPSLEHELFEHDYGTLLMAFHDASSAKRTASAAFNTLLANVPAGLSDPAQTERIAAAAAAYESAREHFLMSATMLHTFMIREIVATRPVIRTAAQHG